MTTEPFVPAPIFTVSGVGPYAIASPYGSGEIQAAAILDGVRTELVAGTDYSVSPDSSETSGNLLLTAPAAATYAGASLVIGRYTPAEQGFLATAGSHERGLEAQLDRIVRATQELQWGLAASLRMDTALSPIVPSEGAALIFEDGQVVAGPTAAQIASAADYAAQAEAAAIFSGAPFASMAAARAAYVTAAVTVIWVWHNGILLAYKRKPGSTALVTADTAEWGPAGPTAYWEHWGLSPRYIDPGELSFDLEAPVTVATIMASAPDSTDIMNAAMAEHVGTIVATGYLRADGQLIYAASCSVIGLAGHMSSVGVSHHSNFDMSVDYCGVLEAGEPGGLIAGFTIHFEQPVEPASRDDLIRYPWALHTGDSARLLLPLIQIVGAVNGIHGRNTAAPSNPGGAVLGTLQLCSFGETFLLNDAYDTVKVDDFRAWPFMIAGFPALLAIYEDGRTTAWRAEKVDGLLVDALSTSKTRVYVGRRARTELRLTGDVGWLTEGETITQATSGATGVVFAVIAGPRTEVWLNSVTGSFDTTNQLTGSTSGALGANSVPTAVGTQAVMATTEITQQYSKMQLDAKHGYLFLEGGKSRINLYTSKVEDELDKTVTCWAGHHEVQVDARTSTDDAFTVNGGFLDVGGRLESEVLGVRMAIVKAGGARFRNCTFKWPDGTTTVPLLRQQGTGYLIVEGCDTDPAMTTVRSIVQYTVDHVANSCRGNRFGPHQITYDQSFRLGFYEGDSKSSRTTNQNTSYISGVSSDTLTDGHNLSVRRSRGTKAAPTKLLATTMIASQIYEGYTGAGWQTVAEWDYDVAAEAGGVLAGQATLHLADAGGAKQPVIEATADGVTILGGLAFAGATVAPPQASRAAFVTWAASASPTVGTVVFAGGFPYEYDGVETAIADLPGWKPHMVPYPDHWTANASPGTTDMTAAVQAAVDYADNDLRRVYVADATYKLTSRITVAIGLRIFGGGCALSHGSVPNTPVGGSWFYLAHTGYGFYCRDDADVGAVKRFTSFKGIGTYRAQPTPGPGWAPTVSSPDFLVEFRVLVEDCVLLNPYIGIRVRAGGVLQIKGDLVGQPLYTGIDYERTPDVNRLTAMKFWPYWANDADVLAYTRTNAVAIRARYVIGLKLGGIFAYGYKRTLLAQDVSGDGKGLTDFTIDWIYSDNAGGGVEIVSEYYPCRGHIGDCIFNSDPAVGGEGAGFELAGATASQITIAGLDVERAHAEAMLVHGAAHKVAATPRRIKDWDRLSTGAYAFKTDDGAKIRLMIEPTFSGGTANQYSPGTGTIELVDATALP